MFNLVYSKNGLWYGKFSSLPDDMVIQAITARYGGVSKNEFFSLNPAMHNGDDLKSVIKNRKIIAESLNIPADKFVTADQVHGDSIYRVTAEDAGRGAYSYADSIPKTDALITNERAVPLMMFFADCVPVMLLDTKNKAIGICHAGWRGTVAKIPYKTVRKMTEEFGSNPEDIQAAIAPSIGPCCYEVDRQVEEKISDSFKEKAPLLLKARGNGKWLLDLWQANKFSLMEAGLSEENIAVSRICTSCNAKIFYSYRADKGKTGRLAAILCLK
jgi:hypothetical protein